MAKEVVWTLKAEETFDEVIDYLENNWGEREIENLVSRPSKSHFR